jgi:Fe-S-cluster containining protein
LDEGISLQREQIFAWLPRNDKFEKYPICDLIMSWHQRRSLPEFIKALQIQASFKCQRCGRCCRLSDPIAITTKDAERIAQYLCIATDEFLSKFAIHTKESDSGLSLLSQPCVFYREGRGCAVYSARPMICRMYPAIAFFVHEMLEDNKCPGMEALDVPSAEFKQGDVETYSSLLAIVQAVQAQGIPVDIHRNEDGCVELRLARYFA